jgi:hypothetical protein
MIRYTRRHGPNEWAKGVATADQVKSGTILRTRISIEKDWRQFNPLLYKFVI